MRTASRTIDDRTRRAITARIEGALSLVGPIAGSIGRWLPPQFRVADLIAAGTLGLVDAGHHFEAHRGVPFECYARRRIRGAILDDVRREGRQQLGIHARAADRRSTIEQLALVHADTLIDPVPNPEADAIAHDQVAQFRTRLRLGLAGLTSRDRAIVIARYAHDRELIDIGQEHGVSASRICQLATQALRQLRDLVPAA